MSRLLKISPCRGTRPTTGPFPIGKIVGRLPSRGDSVFFQQLMRRCLILVLLMAVTCLTGCSRSAKEREAVRVGCKNFSEQLILGEMMAQLLEKRGIPVERKFGFGGTSLIHEALAHGEIDLYAEYTGTAAQAILHLDPNLPLDAVRDAYRKQFKAEWLRPLGFDNTYALAVRDADAAAKGWTRISDLRGDAPSLRAGFNAEFLERADGYPGLKKIYKLEFKKLVNLDAGLIYQALQEKQVDVISAFSTDGRLDAFKLRVLTDDLHFFPRYDPAPVVRQQVLARFPEIRETLEELSGHLDEATMRKLNYEVDGKGRNPKDVARDFLSKQKF